jgi:hypothetical protein
MNDEILDEIYAIRARIESECDHDFVKLGEKYMRLQDEVPPELRVTKKVPRIKPPLTPLPSDIGIDVNVIADKVV